MNFIIRKINYKIISKLQYSSVLSLENLVYFLIVYYSGYIISVLTLPSKSTISKAVLNSTFFFLTYS